MDDDLPYECSDCGTYCDGNCPCNPEPLEWSREQEYRRILSEVERTAGVVTFEDRVRASLSLGLGHSTDTRISMRSSQPW